MGVGELYRHAIQPIWDAVSIYDGAKLFRAQFARVREEQGLLWAAHFSQSEIRNGGLHQLFSNSTGVLAPEGRRGLELIGLGTAADAVARAIAMFGPAYPRARGKRQRLLAGLEKPGEKRVEWDPFYALDEQFFAAVANDRFAELADAFVREHMDWIFT